MQQQPLLSRRQFITSVAASGGLLAADLSFGAGQQVRANNSPITNQWGSAKTTRVAVEHITVFRGSPGQGYSHQPQLISNEGKLSARGRLGLKEKEGPGGRMVRAVSGDRGTTGPGPATVAPARKGEFAESMVVSSGIRINEDGAFVAYYGEW